MSKTVLIVEDERPIVEILKFNLKREGYEVLEALDGKTGLELAKAQDPDLILLDVMLPEMNGFEVCAALRDLGSAVPIIMLTAREEESDKVFGLEAGAKIRHGAEHRVAEGISKSLQQIQKTHTDTSQLKRRTRFSFPEKEDTRKAACFV